MYCNVLVYRAVGATIANRTDELREEDIGTGCGLFEIKKIGDEYFAYLIECKQPKACTILLRGASKDILNEVERNLQDAMNVARNIMIDARLCPGGGATEMALAHVSHSYCWFFIPTSYFYQYIFCVYLYISSQLFSHLHLN